MNQNVINAAITAIESGLEYARQCLNNHDTALGRTTHKNRTWAETIEGDIEQMERALDAISSRPNVQAVPTLARQTANTQPNESP